MMMIGGGKLLVLSIRRMVLLFFLPPVPDDGCLTIFGIFDKMINIREVVIGEGV